MQIAMDGSKAMCRTVFGKGPNAERCERVVEDALGFLAHQEGLTDQPTAIPALQGRELARLGKALSGAQMGIFAECALPCEEGFEKVILRKPDPRVNPKTGRVRDAGVCICRLGIEVRRKFTEPKFDVSEERRKPFGTEKKPKRGRRRDTEFGPGIKTQPVRPLR